jgi:hypothetical protein
VGRAFGRALRRLAIVRTSEAVLTFAAIQGQSGNVEAPGVESAQCTLGAFLCASGPASSAAVSARRRARRFEGVNAIAAER